MSTVIDNENTVKTASTAQNPPPVVTPDDIITAMGDALPPSAQIKLAKILEDYGLYRRTESTRIVPNGYQTFDEALALLIDSRDFQLKQWPLMRDVTRPRSFESWGWLLGTYWRKLRDEVYAQTPSDDQQTGAPNLEGRARVRKYCSILNNLTFWMVQSAMTADDAR